ncbi:hypothetical protein [Flavobacterium rhizosphaerae]|uniref:Signal peptidase n=1 Tax=Flavobacterium rhizosphaerae TaxID=3163298 RepID=A0ABW8YW89_9FLAO
MKKSILKWCMLAFLLISNLAVFAQGGTEDTPEPGDGTEPIDSKLIWLAIIGIAFAFLYFANKRKAVRA